MANINFPSFVSHADATTPAGVTNTITLSTGANWCWTHGPSGQNSPFNVDGTLIFNMAANSSVALGSYSGSDYYGATIGSNGVVTVNGSGEQGAADVSTGVAIGFFNIAGHTTNNGILNISNCSLLNWQNTGTITGSGVINLTNVTLATDISNDQYCYQNATFTNISGQTINMVKSQISFGSNGGVGSLDNVTINCTGGNNYIAINSSIISDVKGLKIRGFGAGDILDLGSIGSNDSYVYDPKTGILTISTNYNGATVSLNIDIGLGYDPSGFTIVKTYTGSTDTGVSYTPAPPCYLAGTMIDTARGLVAVEDITPSDYVLAYEDGKQIARAVIWTGKTRVDATHPPVIIRTNALGVNRPFIDLYVTEEHCLFLDDCFVPVRMLVNGHSIVLDTCSRSYDVYHIELETHSIIRANGLLSESFLDTGHIAFEERESRNLTWEKDGAAPLCTTRGFVEPIFRKIAARVPGLVVTSDEAVAEAVSDVVLLLNDKTPVAPTRRKDSTLVFTINEPIRSLSILTEAKAPNEHIGPFVDDRRMLGVLVGEVYLFSPEGMSTFRSHLDENALTGWHDRESDLYRWTGARAELPDIRTEFETTVVAVTIHA